MIAPTEETEHNKERKNAMQNEELEIIRMSEIQMREVEWLWYPYIPFGKLTIIQGDPGEGKTTFALRLAAACSTGTPKPAPIRKESSVSVRIKNLCICRTVELKRRSCGAMQNC